MADDQFAASLAQVLRELAHRFADEFDAPVATIVQRRKYRGVEHKHTINTPPRSQRSMQRSVVCHA